ncbi:MAG: sigma-70 family RNA polymerase sigma factor [Acidobacteria bacterium]|nr:sigma-70 family RNA polymerase sigma factor [Acidobacteriota bacterium]
MDAVVSWFQNPMDEHSSRVLAGLQNGDPEVLDGLIEEYQHRLFRYALSLTGDRSAAEDIFQETWLRVLERGRQYRAQWKFEVWLFSIARHLVIDRARRKKSTSLDELMNPEEGEFEPQAVNPSPFEDVRDAEQQERIGQLLTLIPAGYREVLTLRFQEDLELSEIATIVGAPFSTVKSRLYRGLEALRRMIERKPL